MWETVSGIIRNIFFSLDKIVFGLIGDVYGLLLQICRTSVFDTDAIHSFSSRIYVFIGLFMLFKLSISLITYLLNPDDFAKGDKNFGKIIKNAILALVMIVLCPYIFTELFEFQSIILEENTIMNVAFGTPTDTSSKVGRYSNSTYADDAGNKIQFTLAYTFAQPNYQEFSHSGYADLIDCKYTYQKDKNGNFKFRKKAVYTDDDKGKDSKFIYQLNPSCFGTYDPDKDEYVQDGVNGQLLMAFAAADSTPAYQDYAQGVAQQSFSLFFKKDAINAKIESGAYVINYRFGISTAVAIGTLYLLLMFCIDLAVRSVKLGFLQMIAPVPILSYVDPKSGKDGMFNKWFKSVKNTYLDLFIRLFALYFGIYVITLVGRFRDVVTGEVVDNWIVRIFMIIGVLIFIKKLPEFLKDALGFEGSGMFKGYLNPLKKFEDEALLGKNITGAASGALVGGIGNAASLWQENKGLGKLKAIPGLLTGAGRGISHGAIEGKGWKAQRERQADMNRKLRTARLNGSTFAGRMADQFGSYTGAETPSETYERKSKTADARLKFNQANLDYVKNTRSTILSDLQNKSRSEFASKGMSAWVTAKDRISAAEDHLAELQSRGATAAEITAARENIAQEREAAIDYVLDRASRDSKQESGAMRGERLKYNTRVESSPFSSDSTGVFNSAPTADQMKNLKDTSQGNVTDLEQEVYRYQSSRQASQYQGDKAANEATRFQNGGK